VEVGAVSAARVDGDPAGLRRILRNLGDNAARHAGARVSFALVERDGAAVLAVDDDGPGIPPADRERVLERFVRLDDARARDAGGSGLGLAIVAELVAAHGGTIAIAASPLGGARIQVSLPHTGEPKPKRT
jgi:signal transduction histidine kinase